MEGIVDTTQEGQEKRIIHLTAWGPDHPRGIQPRGFNNPSNLCYRNAILSVLLHTPVLLNWIEGYHRNNHQCDTTNMNLICALYHLICAYWSEDTEDNLHETWMGFFWETFQQKTENLDLSQGQDAREFLEELIECLYQDVDEPSHRDLNQIFQIQFQRLLNCKECEREKTLRSDERCYLLASTPFPDSDDDEDISYPLSHAVAHGLEEEALNWTCETCNESTTHGISERITYLPEILFIQVNKSMFTEGWCPKLILEDPLTIPDHLISPDSNNGTPSYELYSIIFHGGNGIDTARYASAVMGPTDEWALIENDNVMYGETLDDVLGLDEAPSQSYMFAYRRLRNIERDLKAPSANLDELPVLSASQNSNSPKASSLLDPNSPEDSEGDIPVMLQPISPDPPDDFPDVPVLEEPLSPGDSEEDSQESNSLDAAEENTRKILTTPEPISPDRVVPSTDLQEEDLADEPTLTESATPDRPGSPEQESQVVQESLSTDGFDEDAQEVSTTPEPLCPANTLAPISPNVPNFPEGDLMNASVLAEPASPNPLDTLEEEGVEELLDVPDSQDAPIPTGPTSSGHLDIPAEELQDLPIENTEEVPTVLEPTSTATRAPMEQSDLAVPASPERRLSRQPSVTDSMIRVNKRSRSPSPDARSSYTAHGVTMEETIILPEGTEWKVLRSFPFSADDENPIRMKPRARILRAKVQLKLVSTAGETLEGQVNVSLRRKTQQAVTRPYKRARRTKKAKGRGRGN